MKVVYIFAGPNGAGKTTFATHYLPRIANGVSFINADLIAAGLEASAQFAGFAGGLGGLNGEGVLKFAQIAFDRFQHLGFVIDAEDEDAVHNE